MEAVREAWTDERLDDLNKRVDGGFREAREDTRQFRVEIKTEMDARFDKVDRRFESLERRFDLMFVTLLTGFGSLIVAHFVG